MEEKLKTIKVKDGKWYAIRVVSGKEKKALENLRFGLKVNNLTKYVGDILLPMEKEYKIRNGKKITREKLTFPGYILIEAKLNGELSRLIKRTNFVVEVTGDSKGIPTPLKQKEVDRIIGKIDENIKNDENIPFIVGEVVNIIDGAFSTFKGDIIHIYETKNTLKVNVTIFGRVTPVELSYLQVDKV